MSFASARFLGFLAVLFALYYLIPRRHQWKLLLAGSLFFYWFAGWYCLIYIGVTAVTTWLTGCKLGVLLERQERYLKEHRAEMSREERKAWQAAARKVRFRWMMSCLLLNFGVLAVVKYTGFVMDNLNAGLSLAGAGPLPVPDLVLPMGISFYTFQAMGYLLDVYRGKYPAERSPGKFILFVTFFPQLIQGPISRFDDLSPSLYAEHPWDSRQIAVGAERVLWGLAKKLIVADRLAIPLRALVAGPDAYQGVYVLAVIFLYAIQLYADFTGGIDITIGVAGMFGVRVTENFERPFFSKNTAEYWRRWHITMGAWFRDYVFYPLSVSRPILNLHKKAKNWLWGFGRKLSVYLCTLLLWFVTGIWHGASWNFIVWGLLNGVVILASQTCEPLYEKFHARFPGLKNKFGYRVFEAARTFWLMGLIRVLDVYRDVPLTFRQVGTIFTSFRPSVLWDGSFLELGVTAGDWCVAGLGTLAMLGVSLCSRSEPLWPRLADRPNAARGVCAALIVLTLVFGVYGIGYDATQFIYNQF